MANFTIESASAIVDSKDWRPIIELPVSNHAWIGSLVDNYKFDYREYALVKGTRWCHVVYYANQGAYDLKKFAATTEKALAEWEAAGGDFTTLKPSLDDSILTCLLCTYADAQYWTNTLQGFLSSGNFQGFLGSYTEMRARYDLRGCAQTRMIERYVINPKRLVIAPKHEEDNCPF